MPSSRASTSHSRLVPLLVAAFALLGLYGLGSVLAPGSSPVPALAAPPDGQQVYMTRCMSCHQVNGQGISGVFPPLDKSDWVTGDKERLIKVVLHGLSGPIDVNGVKYSGAMPPWGTFLKDDETAALLTYIRTSWSNKADKVTPEEVAKVRAATADRKKPWTAAELTPKASN